MIAGWLLVAAQASALGGAQRSTPPGAQSPDSIAGQLRSNAVSMGGLPGLIAVPAAAAAPQGSFDITFDEARTPTVFADLGRQQNAFLVFGFLPRLTIGARGSVLVDTLRPFEHRDLSANFLLQLLSEGARRPAVSIAVQDIGGGATPFFESQMAIASKTIARRARVTAGYGTGPDVLDGLFGGIELGLGTWATAIGEYDGARYNGGVRVFPFPGIADRFGVQPRIDIVWRQDLGRTVGFGVRSWLGDFARVTRRQPGADPVARPPGGGTAAPAGATPTGSDPRAPRTRTRSADEVARQLVAMGFENVRVVITPTGSRAIAVHYENRRFNRNELDALGIVMGITSAYAPDSVEKMVITVRRVDVPVLSVESGIGSFAAFVNGRIEAQAFGAQLRVSTDIATGTTAGPVGASLNPSTWKLDLFLRPRVETMVMTDVGPIDSRVTLLPDAYVRLGRGLVLNARRGIHVTQSPGFLGELENANGDRLLVHGAARLPLGGRWQSALGQVSVGRFDYGRVGLAAEVDVPIGSGGVSVGSTVAVFGSNFGTLDRSVALGVARVRHQPWDLTASLTAGRFRNGDVGAMGELSRYFGATELGFFVKATDFTSQGGVRVSVPLAPGRELAPARVRVRFPDLHTQTLQAGVLDGIPIVRRDVGRVLDTDHDLPRAFRSRDRLLPTYVAGHIGILRDAARRWLGSAILTDRPYPEN